MDNKYIKVTQKDRQPVVLLSSNRSFWARQKDVKISEPTQDEIVRFFPEEAKITKTEKPESVKVKNLEKAITDLTAEIETANARVAEVENHNGELAKTITELETEKSALQAEIEKLTAKKEVKQ